LGLLSVSGTVKATIRLLVDAKDAVYGF